VDFNQEAYQNITSAYRNFSSRLDIPDIKFIPISALLGDNVVDSSTNMPWYEGGTLLSHLEEVHVGSDRNLQDCRFPIQYVIRPQTDEARDFRGYAGRVASGVFKVGDEVVGLPSGMQSRVQEIFVGSKSVELAYPPQSVTITLEDDIDLSRGDMLVRENNQPESLQELDAQICWMGEEGLNPSVRYIVRHGTTEIKSMIREVLYKVDINTLHRNEEDKQIGMNDIARIRLRTASPLLADDYRRNRTTGSFILIDPGTNLTVAAGFIS
jgi:sulfate adenylyltransferase subunit 1